MSAALDWIFAIIDDVMVGVKIFIKTYEKLNILWGIGNIQYPTRNIQ